MGEPTSMAAGLSVKSLVAGGAGGALALSVLKQLGVWKSAASVFGGAFAANYLGALVRHNLGLSEEFSGAADFIIGLVFLAVLPGFISCVQKLFSDPAQFVRAIFSKNGGGGDAAP